MLLPAWIFGGWEGGAVLYPFICCSVVAWCRKWSKNCLKLPTSLSARLIPDKMLVWQGNEGWPSVNYSSHNSCGTWLTHFLFFSFFSSNQKQYCYPVASGLLLFHWVMMLTATVTCFHRKLSCAEFGSDETKETEQAATTKKRKNNRKENKKQ